MHKYVIVPTKACVLSPLKVTAHCLSEDDSCTKLYCNPSVQK